MVMKVRSKLSRWLAALALCPVVGWGQPRIITHPQNMTVCVGEDAVFTGRAILENNAQTLHWRIGGTLYGFLSLETQSLIELSDISGGIDKQRAVTFSYNETFNGINVRFIVPTNPAILSHLAYLFYETSHQSPAMGLIAAANDTTVRFDWNKPDSNLTTRFLFGVYDGDNNLVTNQTTYANYISYSRPPRVNGTCQHLVFRVSVDVCPDPDGGFNQTKAATFVYAKPDVSPVTAEYDNNAVLVNWTPDGSSSFKVIITDLESGEQFQTTHDTPPYVYEKTCGKLDIAVSPDQCADDPAFTHSVNISIDCLTSGTQAISLSLLLAVAAIVPLLQWQH